MWSAHQLASIARKHNFSFRGERNSAICHVRVRSYTSISCQSYKGAQHSVSDAIMFIYESGSQKCCLFVVSSSYSCLQLRVIFQHVRVRKSYVISVVLQSSLGTVTSDIKPVIKNSILTNETMSPIKDIAINLFLYFICKLYYKKN